MPPSRRVPVETSISPPLPAFAGREKFRWIDPSAVYAQPARTSPSGAQEET